MPSIETIQGALKLHAPKRIPGSGLMRRAAVAAILRGQGGLSELLLIQRAEREGDPWSGHMAFPGGRHDPEDQHTFDTAVRETQEEIGLDLSNTARCVGRLSHTVASAGGRVKNPLVVSPFVFVLEQIPLLSPNEEVQSVVWVPMRYLLDDTNRSTMPYRFKGMSITLPCYRYEGRTIWGLTLRMIDELLGLLPDR